MNAKKLITPRKLSGFMELEPAKQVIFDDMIDKIKAVYKNYAFMPLDTPVLELSEILLAKSGGEIDKELYAFTKGDTAVCMRYDLTVPLARFVAMNHPNLTFPFKRYQFGKAYRGERAQKGRFREFVQCDADIVGNDKLPLIADAECVNMACDVFKALDLDIIMHISNRNILFGYAEYLGLQNLTIDILIILDKIGKIGKDNAIGELEKLGINDDKANKLISLTLAQGNFETVLAQIENLSDNETYKKGIAELKELYSYLSSYGLNKASFTLDIGIIRGHNYYTGTVFEAYMPKHPEFGSVCGGGRYDNLAGYYTDKHLPGVGISIGLTRLFDLLDKNNMLPEIKPSNIDLQIIPMGETLHECIKLQAYFKNEIVCELNYDERSFKAKMKEANKRQIPFVLIVGENEIKSGLFALKNMLTGQQYNISKEECLNIIKKHSFQ